MAKIFIDLLGYEASKGDKTTTRRISPRALLIAVVVISPPLGHVEDAVIRSCGLSGESIHPVGEGPRSAVAPAPGPLLLLVVPPDPPGPIFSDDCIQLVLLGLGVDGGEVAATFHALQLSSHPC